eukprot:CAMPEP_0197708736 /NCGR_PEP_ID=MMETSP1338-20131121/128103_1 /TAXON_ID=43686 ORGANISM="Pelagodinium beii, Strain RCC1491" /NCGR_SAMPLE_ID=MMETSP1338 /ASSEMBLY_ACC=CAM_ASM_000754 /LENGTH=575 /DNA_ID=CAMNT_0043292667 /DNA_START=94 /DNA_END=1821 /DNA_ORIENTATION=+
MAALACGGAETVCFEPDESTETTNFVKEKEAGTAFYKPVVAYKYDKDGGDYVQEKVVTYTGWRLRVCCKVGIILVLLAGIAAAAIMLALRKDNVVQQDQLITDVNANIEHDVPPASSLPFDCDAGYWNWEKGWSEPKKHWCCDYRNRGCPHMTPAPAPPVIAPPPVFHSSKAYDCQAGLSNAQAGWSSGKKSWCCAVHKVGCPMSQPYDCHAGYSNWQAGWSDSKKEFCCDHYKRGCPHVVSLPFDCDAGFSNWQAGWSEPKKAWCCTHAQRGCFVATSLPYDCDAGFSNWQAGWSEHKKDGAAIMLTEDALLSPLPFPTIATPASPTGRQVGQKTKRYGAAIMLTEDALLSSQPPWPMTVMQATQIGMQVGQHLRKHGAASTGREAVHPRHFHLSDAMQLAVGMALTATCHDRIQYTATHEFAHEDNACGQAYSKVQVECDICRGCSLEASSCSGLEVTIHKPTSLPFDCAAGFSNWKAGWSQPKKAWCCTHEQRGCEVSHFVSLPFDCAAGYARWKDGWSQPKKAWCCAHEQKGCEVSASLPYDCAAGYANWKLGWSEPKKSWCCNHEHRGCA